jgi:hypothetical protein
VPIAPPTRRNGFQPDLNRACGLPAGMSQPNSGGASSPLPPSGTWAGLAGTSDRSRAVSPGRGAYQLRRYRRPLRPAIQSFGGPEWCRRQKWASTTTSSTNTSAALMVTTTGPTTNQRAAMLAPETRDDAPTTNASTVHNTSAHRYRHGRQPSAPSAHGRDQIDDGQHGEDPRHPRGPIDRAAVGRNRREIPRPGQQPHDGSHHCASQRRPRYVHAHPVASPGASSHRGFPSIVNPPASDPPSRRGDSGGPARPSAADGHVHGPYTRTPLALAFSAVGAVEVPERILLPAVRARPGSYETVGRIT